MADDALPAGNLELAATWTAAVRAAESARHDALFNDPWAEALAGPGGMAWLAARSPESVLPIVLRTRFFDDFLLRVLDEDGIRQVVCMAAGFDTRAYRLDLPSNTRVFEVDLAGVLERKRRILNQAGAESRCERLAVAADLSGDWGPQLLAAGLDPGQPAVWLLEGCLYYQTMDDMEGLLARIIKDAAGGSWLGFDAVNTETLTSPLTKPWIEMQAREGAPWLGAIDDPVGYLTRRRWKATQTQFGEDQADFGRWTLPVIPFEERGVPRFWLITARKPYALGADVKSPGPISGPMVPSGPVDPVQSPMQRRMRPR